MKNGAILIIGNQTIPGPKLLDIKITNSFPLINLESKSFLIKSSSVNDTESINGYDHLSIPPDLRLHLTGNNNRRLFFDAGRVWDFLDNNDDGVFHYFTFIGLPFKKTKPIVGHGETKKWYGAEIILPPKDGKFSPETRIVIDIFLHTSPNSVNSGSPPFVFSDIRSVLNNNTNIIVSYTLESLLRKKKHFNKDVYLSIRMGYIDIENSDENAVYLYTPLKKFEKRITVVLKEAAIKLSNLFQ